MDPKETDNNIDEIIEVEAEDSVSVDDFIKQLEENLDIVPDSVIELDEGEFDDSLSLEPLFNTGVQPAAVPKPEPEPATPKEPAPREAASEAELAELNERIRKMEGSRRELLLDSQRRLKDFEAYRKRTERERHETFVNQIANLATQMLPVLDNLNRALDFASVNAEEEGSEFQQFFDGIVMVNQQVNEVLAGMGIVPIRSVGTEFDPHLHEAVAIDDSDELPPNTISNELLRGYRVGEKVIRHSMVKVTRPSAQSEPPGEPEAEAEQFDADAENEYGADNGTPVPAPDEENSVSETQADETENTKEFIFESSNGETFDADENDPQ